MRCHAPGFHLADRTIDITGLRCLSLGCIFHLSILAPPFLRWREIQPGSKVTGQRAGASRLSSLKKAPFQLLGGPYLLLVAMSLDLGGCGDDVVAPAPEPPPSDQIAPDPVTDLAAVSRYTATLTWTATGDDSTTGIASEYRIRYSTEPLGLLTPGGWNAASRVPDVLDPSPAGTFQTFEVVGLENETTYYFGLTVMDEEGNSSGISNIAAATTRGPPELILEWGSFSWGPLCDNGVAMAPNGHVYVVETGYHRIQEYDREGALVSTWGGAGTGEGELIQPTDVAMDRDGNVYVVEAVNQRIQKFDASGTFLQSFRRLRGPEFSMAPMGVALDGEGNICITDVANDIIWKLDQEGWPLWWTRGGESGFVEPTDIAVSPEGTIYVADGNHIWKFDGNGKLLWKWASKARHVAVDTEGNIYVSGVEGIQLFHENGILLTEWSLEGSDWGSLAVNEVNHVYVVECSKHSIQKFGREPSL